MIGWWLDLPRWLRYLVPLVILGAAGFVQTQGEFWWWGWGIGLALLCAALFISED